MDISSLLTALQDEQAKKSSVRLSERNVVELVLKLKQLGLFGDELLHTINGKEYITTDRLRADIETALRQAGGRLELTELPALVGVDLVHCEKQAALIVEESGGRVLDAQGELITTQYFDALAAEVDDMLQESGVLALADLAVSYALNTELLRASLAARVGPGAAIRGRLEGGLLHTPAYARNVKARLRGALRGTAAPVPLAALSKAAGLHDQQGGGHGMLAGLVEELAAEGAAQGSTRGGGGSWVPAVHTQQQQAAVSGFYAHNGWVGYELVRKAGISGEKAYLAGRFPEGVGLATVFVSPALIAQAEAAADEALRGGGWLDVATVLPSALGAADVAQLLEQCGGLAKDREGKQGQVLAGTCVVSAPLVASAREAAEAFAKQEADKALQGRRASGAGAAASSANGGAAAEPQEGSKHGSNGAAAKKAEAAGADSDDDWSMGAGKKGRKGGKGGGGAKGKGGKAAAGGGGGGAAAGGKQQKGGGAVADVNSLLSVSVLAQLLVDLFPDMEDAGPSGGLPKALAELVRPAALAAHQEALASVFTSGALARRKAKEGALRALEDAFALLQLYAQGSELLQADEATLAIMQRHLLRSTGTDALDALLAWCLQEFADQEPAVAEAAEAHAAAAGADAAGGAGGWTPAERTRLVKALPQEVGQPLGKALEAAGALDPQEFISDLEAAAGECGIRLRQLDKKSEKSALTAQKARLMQLLHAEQAPAAVLALALPLLVAKVCGRLVNIPGRAISGVLALLQPQLEEEQFDLVQRFHEGVVDSLRAAAAAGGGGRSQQAGGGAGAAVAGQQQQQQQLEAQVQQLKALVGVETAATSGSSS